MPKEKKPTIVEVLTDLIGVVKDMAQKIDKLSEPEAKISKTIERSVTETTSETFERAYSVPSDYRDIIDTTLNKNFGVEVVPLSDRPAFMLSILVPESYSNATKPYLEMYKKDVRPKVIYNHESLNGVKEWAEMVYNNFDLETKSRITADRINNLVV